MPGAPAPRRAFRIAGQLRAVPSPERLRHVLRDEHGLSAEAAEAVARAAWRAGECRALGVEVHEEERLPADLKPHGKPPAGEVR